MLAQLCGWDVARCLIEDGLQCALWNRCVIGDDKGFDGLRGDAAKFDVGADFVNGDKSKAFKDGNQLVTAQGLKLDPHRRWMAIRSW